MNQSFVSIKVDREERPDIDRIYMAYVQTMDSGGWPMSVFLTPDLKPFLGASYLPPDDRGGALGFRTLLQRVNELWTTDRPRALRAADTGARLMTDMQASGERPAAAVDASALDDAFTAIRASFDAVEGGFGSAPKFPRPVVLTFLLRDYARTGRKPALDMTLRTLDAMARGGIHDQLGGGFHRYATDAAWRVPHFEKMLYDQAQLAVSYAEAYQITRDAAYAAVARDILDYTLRDMRSPEGGFFSAEDADSAVADGTRRRGRRRLLRLESRRAAARARQRAGAICSRSTTACSRPATSRHRARRTATKGRRSGRFDRVAPSLPGAHPRRDRAAVSQAGIRRRDAARHRPTHPARSAGEAAAADAR